MSVTIRKVLASAVANAQHNDELDPETLYVKACFADEGPTLKRFTPRARGRAGRIRKRTTHITIVLGVLDDDRLEIVQAREARRTAAGRRRRGATAAPASSRRAAASSAAASAPPQLRDGDAETTEPSRDRAEQLPAGAALPNEDGSAPDGFEIKGNADSMLYHVPGSRFYDQTIAEIYFATADDAEAAGFSCPRAERDDDAEAATDDADESTIASADEPKNDADGDAEQENN